MAWNARRYEQGYADAEDTLGRYGLELALKEYVSLEDAKAVNEYEVGFRTRLELAAGRVLETIRLEG